MESARPNSLTQSPRATSPSWISHLRTLRSTISPHFVPRDSPKVSWGHCTFAERTAELYLVGSSGTSPVAIAESIFSDALDSPGLSRDPATRARFEDSARQHIRLTPDFARLSAPRDRDICSSYWQRILERVITPLASQSNDSSKNIKNRTCSNDPAVLLSLAMKLSAKLPHELSREDILHAVHYEGNTIANALSQTFARYKVEQYSWAHTQSETTGVSVQELISEYRNSNVPPWVLLRQGLDRLRDTSDDPHLFDFEFSDPEDDRLSFSDHLSYSFQAAFRNRTTGDSYSITTLSSGEQILMALCLATFHQRMGRGRPKLLLLDELDAVLHPSMVSAISAIDKPSYTSHSIVSLAFAYPHFWMAETRCWPSTTQLVPFTRQTAGMPKLLMSNSAAIRSLFASRKARCALPAGGTRKLSRRSFSIRERWRRDCKPRPPCAAGG